MDKIREQIQKIDRQIELWKQELNKERISKEYHDAEVNDLLAARRILVNNIEKLKDKKKYEDNKGN